VNAVSAILFAVAVFEGLVLLIRYMESKRRCRIASTALVLTGVTLLLLPSQDKDKPSAVAQPEPPAVTVPQVAAAPDRVPKLAQVDVPAPKNAPVKDRWVPVSSSSPQVVTRGGKQFFITRVSQSEINEATGEVRHVRSWVE